MQPIIPCQLVLGILQFLGSWRSWAERVSLGRPWPTWTLELDDGSFQYNLELRIFAPYATLSRLAHERVSLHHRQTCPAMRR